MNQTLSKKLRGLPQKPGVYIFKDAKGLVLYVGKAVKLKNRVTSYFKKGGGENRGPRIELMIAQIADLDYTVTDNELECLILENNFIKQLKPKYNVMLRDDKNYLFLKINIKDEIPTIGYDRKPDDKSASYFGPYTSGLAIKDTLRLMRKIFPYCANFKVGTKPCFYYHIGKCPGVCIGKISLEDYREHYIKKIIQFLDGRQSEILKELQYQMRTYAQTKQYEKAAKVRDQIFTLNRVLERQKLVYPKKIDQDVFSIYQNGVTVINLFIIREGKLIRKENFILENTKGATAEEILAEFLPKYYLDASSWPKEILLPVKINSPQPPLKLRGGGATAPGGVATPLSRLIGGTSPLKGEKNKKPPKILIPSRGPKLNLIRLGTENARQYWESTSDKHLLEEARSLSALRELQRVLNLPDLPGRIEAYDISNIQGTNPVGSMIVFDFARPKKQDYRKFKINKKQTPDDFAMMKEMLERRFKHDWPKPDLILIDGGKGQLSSAVSVLKKYNLKIPIIGLAKRLEEIFQPLNPRPSNLAPNSIALFLLQRIRDEAHRFAIKYHRQLRAKGSLSSVLDEISGIGPAKKKILLQKYGSAGRIRQADLTELGNLIGKKFAEKIKASL